MKDTIGYLAKLVSSAFRPEVPQSDELGDEVFFFFFTE